MAKAKVVEEKVTEESIEEESPEESPEESLPDATPDEPSPNSPEPVTEEDIWAMEAAANHWEMHGAPEKSAVLRECMAQGRRAPSNLLYFGTEVKPETTIDPTSIELPPRTGPSASADKWREFAKKTTDMEHEILNAMQRKDLISLLETKGVIPKEGKQ